MHCFQKERNSGKEEGEKEIAKEDEHRMRTSSIIVKASERASVFIERKSDREKGRLRESGNKKG